MSAHTMYNVCVLCLHEPGSRFLFAISGAEQCLIRRQGGLVIWGCHTNIMLSAATRGLPTSPPPQTKCLPHSFLFVLLCVSIVKDRECRIVCNRRTRQKTDWDGRQHIIGVRRFTALGHRMKQYVLGWGILAVLCWDC